MSTLSPYQGFLFWILFCWGFVSVKGSPAATLSSSDSRQQQLHVAVSNSGAAVTSNYQCAQGLHTATAAEQRQLQREAGSRWPYTHTRTYAHTRSAKSALAVAVPNCNEKDSGWPHVREPRGMRACFGQGGYDVHGRRRRPTCTD